MLETKAIWLRIDNQEELTHLENLMHRSGGFSVSISRRIVSKKSSGYALLVGPGNRLTHYMLWTSGGGSAGSDLDIKVRAESPVALIQPISVQELSNHLPPKFARYCNVANSRASKVTPGLFAAVVECIVALGLVPANQVERLRDLLKSKRRIRRFLTAPAQAEERDAFAIALELGGGAEARRKFLDPVVPHKGHRFIDDFVRSGATMLEDEMIVHDMMHSFFGDKIERKVIVGAVVIRTRHNRLLVVNANRKKIENTLGVDLVYYSEATDSFVMVQYKRLTGTYPPRYRPIDQSYRRELGRMLEFDRLRAEMHRAEDASAYRLEHSPFFIKLCDATRPPKPGAMTGGMYFPIALWNDLLLRPEARGTAGGLAISYENAGRYLTSSLFTTLVRDGWVGSSGNFSSFLRTQLTELVESGHSVIAVKSVPAREPDEYVRDHRGRFTNDDDPDAFDVPF